MSFFMQIIFSAVITVFFHLGLRHHCYLPGTLAAGFEAGSLRFTSMRYGWLSLLDQLASQESEFHEKLVSTEKNLVGCLLYSL